ncbi:glycoside hydrolase [Radiomyces spectabilis]|uniref:glycoside hydrolase n=1 Tax=Radiomyces spectabilis TaxID=64574 RepID=UPI002220EFEB|nr:glycoside hydrolase [Radiomyces spectabilis]KAI8369276.1 glycoside hydrolase [Radiomyces spectabilis]
MLVMGLEDEYKRSLEFVANVDFSVSDDPVKGFETNIRYLGGLLSAYDLRPDPILLQKAVELTDTVLLPLFDSPSKAPYTYMDLTKMVPEKTTSINLAEFGTYSLEFTRLSQLTGDSKYADLSNSLIDRAISVQSDIPGLYPIDWDIKTFTPLPSSAISIGGGADSFYEYLVKNYILLGQSDSHLMEAWVKAVDSIEHYLLSPATQHSSVKFAGEISRGKPQYQSGELICFWPGNILLGVHLMSHENDSTQQRFRTLADDLLTSCLDVWTHSPHGIAPEAWSWDPQKPSTSGNKSDLFTIIDSSYDLRPETLESVFYFYRITGDPKYQDIAWELFEAINEHTRTDAGFTRLRSMDTDVPLKADFQESFLFAETLKYLYLTFVDKECLSLDDYVFSTEAHPFKLSSSIAVQSE